MTFALVFPGQGSQSAGMMNGYQDVPVVRNTFAEAGDILGQNFWTLATEGPAEALNLTVNTQPLMLIAGVAVYRAWQELCGREPGALAGHSLGEYSALVCAGALRFADALPLVRLRAQAMQEAVPLGEGAMAAILGVDDDIVRAACRAAAQGQIVEAVNFNAPSQVVIAGHKAAVERAMLGAKAAGAKRAVLLPVSAPFHSSLLQPAAKRLSARLLEIEITAPRIPVLNNVDVAFETEPQAIKLALARQACSPVRWVEAVQAMAQRGIRQIAECGPGKVLAGLTKRIDPELQSFALTDSNAIRQACSALH